MEKEKMVAIVRGVQQGDEAAMTQLYEAFQPDIYFFIRKNVNNDTQLAEDLTQDTFIEILDTIDKLEEPAAFSAWSQRIAYHKCTAYFRKRHELLADENEDGGSVFDTIEEDRAEFIPDEALDKEDLKRTILAMVNSLPQEQRAAIMLRYYNEVSVKQIAQIQGVSENTVKSRLNYGRKFIKQAVEEYEKKNDIKLHSVGIVPLLLWLFREYALANGLSITTKAAATAVAAGASAAGGTTAATTAVTTGAKVAGKFAAKKIIAGITAAAVITGGVTAGVLLSRQPEEEPAERPMTWSGYGTDLNSVFYDRRFDLTLEQLDEDTIGGYLECSHLYEVRHASNFEGTGTQQEDGTVTYEVTFETPAVMGTIPTFEYSEIIMVYDKETETFTMDDFYEVTLLRTDTIEEETIAKNVTWSGYGEDLLYQYATCTCNEHLFEFKIDRLTTTQISGRMTLSKNGEINHESEFTGKGYVRDGMIYYEIDLETSRTVEYLLVCTQDCFWMKYDMEADTLEIPGLSGGFYQVVMQRDN